MKDIKPHSLLTIALVLIGLSFTLLGIWGYHKYFRIESSGKGPSSAPQREKSLNKDEKNSQADKSGDVEKTDIEIEAGNASGEMKSQPAAKNKNGLSEKELEIAKGKIAELNNKIKQLSDSVKKVEKENIMLKEELKSPVKSSGKTGSIYPVTPKISTPVTKKEKVQNKPAPAIPVKNTPPKTSQKPGAKITSAPVEQEPTGAKKSGSIQVKLASIKAFYMGADNQEVKAVEYSKAEKFAGAITVKNTSRTSEIIQLYLVIIRPDGKTLFSAWESGNFQTREGKKNYTLKLSFDSEGGETKTLSYSIYPDKFIRGNYRLLIYHEGRLAGSAITTLN